MMVPDRTVGLIIGRGGETIRDLQDRSGCHVNIVGENKSINGMRPVNLIGSASAQQYARDLILEIVESDQKGISVKDLHREREDAHVGHTGSMGMGAGGSGGAGSSGGGGGKINDSIIVPGDAVGMIIGKGTHYVSIFSADTNTVQGVSLFVTCRTRQVARSTCRQTPDETSIGRLVSSAVAMPSMLRKGPLWRKLMSWYVVDHQAAKQLLTESSVLEHKLVNVKVETIIRTGIRDSRPGIRPLRLHQRNRLRRLRSPEPQIPMLLTVAIRTTCRCGMQPWHNNNRVAKVSNDEDALS